MTDRRFTGEDVIKGLGCCRTIDGNDCQSCPYYGKHYEIGSGGCSNHLVNDALETIKRQKAEVACWQDTAANARREILLEIERLALSKIPEDVEVAMLKDTYYIEALDELMIKYGVTDKNVGCNKEEQK